MPLNIRTLCVKSGRNAVPPACEDYLRDELLPTAARGEVLYCTVGGQGVERVDTSVLAADKPEPIMTEFYKLFLT